MIKKIVNYPLIILVTSLACQMAQAFTLVLDPAGDAEHPGRIIHDSYERGITLQFCNELKKKIEATTRDVRVILTRVPGEPMSEFLQNANFSNKLNADLFLSIHFYKEKNITPRIWLYYMQNEPFFKKPHKHDLIFYPYDKIWMVNIETTKNLIRVFQDELRAISGYEVHKAAGIPCKPLAGIKSPACILEIGINTFPIKELIDHIAEALKKVIEYA